MERTAAPAAAGVRRISTADQARELAGLLNGSRRRLPVVVVSIPNGRAAPWIDAERIAGELEGLAEVRLLEAEASWAFTAAMPGGTQVFDGAGRVYPLGLDWVRDLRRSRLRFAAGEEDGEAATGALIDDALAAALAAGLLATAAPERGGQVEGEVVGCPTSSQAMVRLDAGDGYAAVQVGIAFPGLTAERVFRSGMRVRGHLDRATGQLDIRQHLPDPAGRAAGLVDGAVLPARVESVAASGCVLAVHPGLPLPVPAERVSDDPQEDVRDLLSEGEVVAVRLRTGPQGWFLELVGVDPADCGAALALLPDGPPWLPPPPTEAPGPAPDELPDLRMTPRETPPDTAPAPAPPAPMLPAPTAPTAPTLPAPSRPSPMDLARPRRPATVPAPAAPGKALQELGLALETARAAERLAAATVRDLRAEVILLQRDLAAANRERLQREETLSRLRRRYRTARGASSGQPDDEVLFGDPIEQFRFEVLRRWARRIPAADQAARPLRGYRLGPAFLPSLDALAGVDRVKVVDVVVEVLTGLADNLPGREMHALRASDGPGAEPLRRDGRTCWRVALQQGTPGARRLHFWRGRDEIELSRVVLHDDFTP
jgi:hypothetical protein